MTDAGNKDRRAKRAIVISLDGLDARYIERRDEYGLKIPVLRKLIAEGVYAKRTVPVYPSITYTVHTTIVTGAYPAKHGILGNWLFEPPGEAQTGAWHWFANDIQADTLWDAARRAGLKTGIVSWPVAGGAGDYCIPEILSPSYTLADARRTLSEHSMPKGFLEECERECPRLYEGVTRDEHDEMRTRVAGYLLARHRPELLLVHLFDFDHWQHDFAPFSPESFEMLERIDSYTGRIIAAAETSGTLGESAVFILSDHGFVPISKLFHPNAALNAAGFLPSGEGARDWRAVAYLSGCSCAIILRDECDSETRSAVTELFRRLESANGSGIKRVFDRDEIQLMGANTRAALMLEAEDEFAFGFNAEGEVVTQSVQLGQHGHHPDGQSAVFIAAGAGIQRRGEIETMRLVDAGPSIARTLGIELRDADGTAVEI